MALISVAPGAGALPTFLPIDVSSPRVGTVWGAAVAGIGVVNHDGVRDPPRGGNFNMFSVAQADPQTLLVSSTTVTGGDTQTGTGLLRVLEIGAPGNLSELRACRSRVRYT